jgi:hypothetical protein
MFCSTFTDNHLFYVSKSKYSGEKSTRTSEVPAPFYLAISVNVQYLQQIKDKQVPFSFCNIILILLFDTLPSVCQQWH